MRHAQENRADGFAPGLGSGRSGDSAAVCWPRLGFGPGSRLGLSLLVGLLALTPPARAQRAPHIGYVYPAGARAEATSQVVVGGQFLDGVTGAMVSGPGVTTTVVDFNKPMNQGQFNMLRDRLQQLQEQKRAALRPGAGAGGANTNTWTAADEKALAELRERLLKNPPNRNATPAIAEVVTLRVTVAGDAPPGDRELRLITPLGLSNPLKFTVGCLPEFSDPPAKPANPDLARFLERFGRPPPPAPNAERRIRLPAVVNGQIGPGEVDRFRFSARRGQHLVAAVRARDLIPYLADAVPGWFQATLALYDAKGNELAYVDDFRFHPDPVLHHQIPKDGEYVLEIKDAIYRGREDFVYRITIGELPFLTGLFPLGGPAGSTTVVELQGWNLPTNRLAVTLPKDGPPLHFVSVPGQSPEANRLPFAAGTLPECTEREPNDAPTQAQSVTLPCVINGRVDKPGDPDVFRIEGRAGDRLVAEVTARRLGSPLDSLLTLTDSQGRQVAVNDDFEDRASGLNTHHADSYLTATLPSDGIYYIRLGDAQRHGDPAHAYRLRLSPPQPDFELRVVPASVSARAGGTVSLTIHALRKDGCTNDITVVLDSAPAGFRLGRTVISATNTQTQAVLTVPSIPQPEPVALRLVGRAVVAGDALLRPVVPAEDMMQAFAYRHLVPAETLQVAVMGRPRFAPAPKGVPKKAASLPPRRRAKLRNTLQPRPTGGTHLPNEVSPDAAVANRS